MKALDKGCQIVRIPDPDGDTHKKALVRASIPLTDGVFQPFVHHNCIHNQIVSLRNRVLGVVPHPTDNGMEMLRRGLSALVRPLPSVLPEGLYALSERHSGAKARRYREAADEVTMLGLTKHDAAVTMFVKAERLDPTSKVNPDPRAIQFRGARFCVVVSQYLHPIEQVVFQVKHISKGVPRTRNVAKGLNSVERAKLLHVKMSAFSRPVVFSLDCSRWDQHVTRKLLRLEHEVYAKMCNDPVFLHLLGWQMVNKGYSSLGLRYVADARRMSGDMNTALGNVVLMLIMILTAMTELRVAKWDTLDDGDDALLMVEEEDFAHVAGRLSGVFLEFGMELKVENVARSIHEVVFCQSKVVEFRPNEYKFVRDYRKIFSKALCGIKGWEDERYRMRVISAIGQCELALSLGVPVLQNFAQALIRWTVKADVAKYAPGHLLYRTRHELRTLGLKVEHVRPQTIEWCARESFAEAFGLEPDAQLRLESQLDAWNPELRGLRWEGQEIEALSWSILPTHAELHQLAV